MKTTAQTKSYIGERVYVGIDVHKRTYSVVARVKQMEVKRWTTAAEPEKFGEQLGQFFPGAEIRSAYEAGFSGFGLHRELQRQGIKNIVVHAAAIEVAANQRVKTDKRDARKISEHLEAGRLRGIRIPSEAQEEARLLSRTRRQLVRQRTQSQNCIRMKAHQFGLISPEDRRRMPHSLVTDLLKACKSEEFRCTVMSHQRIWQALDQEIVQLEARLKAQADADPCETTYRSVPGVGAVSARILANELADLSHFNNERQLFSYTGLTPAEYSSGENTRRGSITKQGNAQVRGILIEVAWRAIEEDASLASFFERVKAPQGSKRAIVGVARKLIGRIRAAFRHQVPYHIDEVVPEEGGTEEVVTAA
jgi:transposase